MILYSYENILIADIIVSIGSLILFIVFYLTMRYDQLIMKTTNDFSRIWNYSVKYSDGKEEMAMKLRANLLRAADWPLGIAMLEAMSELIDLKKAAIEARRMGVSEGSTHELSYEADKIALALWRYGPYVASSAEQSVEPDDLESHMRQEVEKLSSIAQRAKDARISLAALTFSIGTGRLAPTERNFHLIINELRLMSKIFDETTSTQSIISQDVPESVIIAPTILIVGDIKEVGRAMLSRAEDPWDISHLQQAYFMSVFRACKEKGVLPFERLHLGITGTPYAEKAGKARPNAMVESKDGSTWLYRGGSLKNGTLAPRNTRPWTYKQIVDTFNLSDLA